MTKKTTLIVFIVLSLLIKLNGQIDSRNGWIHTGHDTVRVFMVFAEMINDPNYSWQNARWPKGEMPNNPQDYFEPNINGEIDAYITKYFNQASFGNFIMLGDYYPNLIQIDYNQANYSGVSDVYTALNNTPGDDIITANGLSFKNDFDQWAGYTNQSEGLPKIKVSNNKIDVFILLWRVNSNYSAEHNSGVGYTSPWGGTFNIKGVEGYDTFIFMKDLASCPDGQIAHEYAHNYLGGNNFHTGGAGASGWCFLSTPNINSSLSYSSSISHLYSGLERRRIGWKPKATSYEIKAWDESNSDEINADLTYGQDLTGHDNEVILRDFVTTGDAIRIKLPYLKSESSDVRDQWLWLENHQKREGNIDHSGGVQPKGVYAYMQVDKETMTGAETFDGNANYTFGLHPYGNYDIEYENVKMPAKTDTAYTESLPKEDYIQKIIQATVNVDTVNRQNPFTGYGINIEGAFDIKENIVGGVTYYDEIFRDERVLANKLVINGNEYPSSYFDYLQYPVFGTKFDAYNVGSKITLSTNPATVPLYTYAQKSSNSNRPFLDKPEDDNNKIYLNGISVEFVEQYANGDIKVRILWDNYNVDNDVRWCGDIVLTEKVNLLENKTITLDYGTMPTRPVDPVMFDGKKVFNDPTVFTCNSSSEFRQQANSTVVVKNQSTLKLMEGSTYIIEDGATLVIQSNSKLVTNPCSKIIINGTGKLIYETGAISSIAPNTILDFENGSQNFVQQGYTNYLANTWEIAYVLPPTYTISTTANWANTSYQLTRDLVIQPQGVLNLTQGEIDCQNDSRIIVNPGGKLIVDGAKLIAKSCTSAWHGIELHGDRLAHQSAATQPTVELKNGAIIENAINGVTAGDPARPGVYGGGIIKAYGVTFRNCETGIGFQLYKNYRPQLPAKEINNLSYITKCTFETDADILNITNKPYAGIALWGVKGISIKGNTFVNLSPSSFNRNDLGYGVVITGASCSIEPYCTGIDCSNKTQNTFTDLNYGVLVTSSTSLSNVVIADNMFINNSIAIEMSGSYSGKAYYNNIQLMQNGLIGFQMNRCHNFNIDENQITGQGSGIGIFATNSSTTIYKNSLSNLTTGILTSTSPNLQFTCNEFNTNGTHISIHYDGADIAQGSVSKAAGNKFLPVCTGGSNEIKLY
ncbi:MAG: NosD domain-containing protein, partial [Salinivirgaceae bacterium]|nr:NosD domain-containing protein [Salinivirgaceae bacterium]